MDSRRPANHRQAERACEQALTMYHNLYGYSGTDNGPAPMLVVLRADDRYGVVAKGVQMPGIGWAGHTPTQVLHSLTAKVSRGGHGILMGGTSVASLVVGMGLVVEGWGVDLYPDDDDDDDDLRDPATHPDRRQVHQLYAHLTHAGYCYGYSVMYVEGEPIPRPVIDDGWGLADGALAEALADFTHAIIGASVQTLN